MSHAWMRTVRDTQDGKYVSFEVGSARKNLLLQNLNSSESPDALALSDADLVCVHQAVPSLILFQE